MSEGHSKKMTAPQSHRASGTAAQGRPWGYKKHTVQGRPSEAKAIKAREERKRKKKHRKNR